MRVYIAGPITGLTEAEYTTNFGLCEAKLMELGHDPVNPLKVMPCETEDCRTDKSVVGGQSLTKDDGTYLHSWECYMKHDLAALLTCEGIAVLPGYSDSRGASIEYQLAVDLDYTIVYHDGTTRSTEDD